MASMHGTVFVLVHSIFGGLMHLDTIIKTNNCRSFLHIRPRDVHVRSEPKTCVHLTALYLRVLLRCVLNDRESFVLIIGCINNVYNCVHTPYVMCVRTAHLRIYAPRAQPEVSLDLIQNSWEFKFTHNFMSL
jgi:hypothetical protein